MTDIYKTYTKEFGIDEDVWRFSEKILAGLTDAFAEADRVAEAGQLKVLAAFKRAKISDAHFAGTTGYGYDDIGRDALEAVYADIFRTEDALVRPQIVSGTHAINLALSGNLRPGDELLSPAGALYDTMDQIIGIRDCPGSLKEYGISYRQVDLLSDNSFDYDGIRNAINEKTKLVTIQRSCGYSSRPSFTIEKIEELIGFIRGIKPEVIIMVDNCYGEFVQMREPTEAGADMVVGSLIKNPGGSLAPCGGYIAGKKECVENAAYRLTSPGLGKETGATLYSMKSFLQGLFTAPTVVASALKGAIFAAACYESLGYKTFPKSDEKRTDIIQAVEMKTPEALLKFCEGIQAASPVDSFVTPVADDMPGYEDKVVMAAGAFIQGASIELSADGPLREPYNVYFQGGITWPHVKIGIMNTLQTLKEAGLTKIPF